MLRLSSVSRLVRRALCVSTEGMGKKGSFFYAVKKGHRPGVYQTWEECKFQVDRFPDARYKKFGREDEAWAFVRNETTSTENSEATLHTPSVPVCSKRSVEEDEVDGGSVKRAKLDPSAANSTSGLTYMGDAVVVYTDGCCTKNGRHGARAGIGVYWGPSHPLNVAERLPGRQTNQRAELQAACKALEQAIHMEIKKLVVYTDSKFTINGITSWVKKWKTNGWRLQTGGKVVNKEDFQKLDELNGGLDVKWMHIPGHAGYLGNEEADRLSREGAAKPQL
ncbi:ribonuclease H1 isoform X1 [Ictalurus furcatus]|uniref:ribonuclease H1 isoform X1 n=2 Tax=Ictalurus furcatus TaxID=66913 RepID=UPI00234FF841|nr:ribonuclease H1 isoform X1 [Ictalurus furcatus]